MKRLAASALIVAAHMAPVSADTGFLDRSVTVTGETYAYQVYVPREWSATQRWPVILFLHGGGERGGDGMLPTHVGIGAAIRRNRTPAFLPSSCSLKRAKVGDGRIRQCWSLRLRRSTRQQKSSTAIRIESTEPGSR
jgi:hypothetical protein